MKVAMPRGSSHGWGIAGTYLSAEIAKLPPLEGVTLHSIAGHHFAPSDPDQWDSINIGYCFFESEIIAYRFIPEAARQWDHIVAGSSWCEYHLRIAGMDRTSTILQGVDPTIFPPAPPRPDDGRFVVFSGGKFEFRKGQDLVIAAMRAFMHNHSDVWLACAWHNHWPASIRTMEQTTLIDFSFHDQPCDRLFPEILSQNGIPLDRVVFYPVLDNRLMCEAYVASDLGLFPNRCEGGNNMVMCEYMACSRPVIASAMTGHRDVITPRNAYCLTQYEPIVATHNGAAAGVWFEPSVDETIAFLERAYADRLEMAAIGGVASASMQQLSWQDAARKFHALGAQLAEEKRHRQRIETSSGHNLFAQATGLFNAGRFSDALAAFSQLLARSPLDPDLLNNIGTVLDRLERYAEAILHYEKALVLRPNFTAARFNLANSLQRNGDTPAAIAQLREVLAVQPDFKEAWQNLALCLLNSDDLAGSTDALRKVLEIDPTCIRSRADLGELLSQMGCYEEALACFQEVLAHDPDNAGVLNSTGVAHQRLNDLDAAEACYRRILANDPDNTLALNNLGTVMRARALPERAIEYFDRALAIEPDNGQLLFNRSLAHLLMGNFELGWRDYEHRFRGNPPVLLRHTALQRWTGQPPEGKTVLVWCEQGYGDAIQFVRYAGALAETGAIVIVEAQDTRIAPLLARARGVSRVVVRDQEKIEADFQVPLLSLPAILGNIPCPPRYLELSEADLTFGRDALRNECRKKIGIAWAGRPSHEDDRNRSIPSCLLAPLATVTDTLFVSLQFSPAGEIPGLSLLDLTGTMTSFVESASLIAQLDLVISVDTAVAHLAGALGVPAWVLLPFNPDWRWLLGRDDTPWYRSARLIRQKSPGAWEGVIAALVGQLE